MADWLTEELGSLCTKTFVVQCVRVKDFCCVVDAIPLYCHTKTFVGFSRLMYARHKYKFVPDFCCPLIIPFLCCQALWLRASMIAFFLRDPTSFPVPSLPPM